MSIKAPDNPPMASRVEATQSAHGQHWNDPYAWLKAENWQEAVNNPSLLPTAISDYLQQENSYYERATNHLAPLHEELIAEIRGRMAEKVDYVAEPDGPYKYSTRYVENAEHSIRLRTDLDGNNETVLLDINKEANGFEYFDLGVVEHSPDHNTLLWSCDTNGSEFYSLYFRDIALGKDKDYVIKNVDTATWGNANTVFYTRLDDAHRALQVYKHVLGNNPDHDELVFEEQDERFYCTVSSSLSRNFVFIHTCMNDQDEIWFIQGNELDSKPALVQRRTTELEYNVIDQQGDNFIITTNAQGATDWKLVTCPVSAPSIDNWEDLLAHREGTMIETVVVFQRWVVWLEMVDALLQIAFMDKEGNIEYVLFNEEAYSLDLYEGFEYDTDRILFEYSSPTTPSQTFEFNLLSSERFLVQQQTIPSGHNPEDYVTRRFSVASHDGAQVPVTLLYHQDTALDGSAPALLYGYGSYGASTYAEFEHAPLSLVDRGFVYAIAHVRGGEERGCAWYEAAKKEKKINSFLDFIAVGEALVAKGYCAAGRIVSLGGSAGGMLVAASMNMKPDLFAGVVAHVPFVDVLNTMLDESLPATPGEWTQWGNPIDSESAFHTIKSYSPYENVKAINYPPLYVTAGVSDPRVTYWEPAKWVARLRALKTDNNVVLLKTNMQSGHFGKTGRFAKLDDTARTYAFALSVVNLTADTTS